MKIENSFQAIFDEIWLKTMYYTIVQGLWPNFGGALKIHKKSNFDWKFLHNIRTCTCMRKNYKTGEFSPSHFWSNTLYYSTGYLA